MHGAYYIKLETSIDYSITNAEISRHMYTSLIRCSILPKGHMIYTFKSLAFINTLPNKEESYVKAQRYVM